MTVSKSGGRKKAKGILMHCKRVVGPTWGFKPATLRWIFEVMVRQVQVYGATIWLKYTRSEPNTTGRCLMGSKIQMLTKQCLLLRECLLSLKTLYDNWESTHSPSNLGIIRTALPKLYTWIKLTQLFRLKCLLWERQPLSSLTIRQGRKIKDNDKLWQSSCH